MKIFTFDTTLRDGTQGESVSFSVDDKLTIARKLDDQGIDYIEGGWPGSNPKDRDFFARASELNLQHAKLTAFGSTRFAKNPVQEEDKLHELYDSLVEARRSIGEDALPFHKFADLVKTQVKKLRENGSPEVAFRVAVKDGKVNFTARAMKGTKE